MGSGVGKRFGVGDLKTHWSSISVLGAQAHRERYLPADGEGSGLTQSLRFDRITDGAPWSFRQLFPRLLAGDSDVPLDK